MARAKIHKFQKGKAIKTMADLSKLLDAGEWVYQFDRPKHHGWLISMSYRTLAYFVKMGALFRAIPDDRACQYHNPPHRRGSETCLRRLSEEVPF